MTIVYLVRHGQTDWNKLGVFRGRADRPLDEVGEQQARLVKDALKDKGITKLYASPMQRTVQTFASLSAALRHRQITIIDELIDINYGVWQGKDKQDVARQWPDLWKQWHEDPFGVVFPDGEALADVQIRALKGLGKIIEDAGDDTIAVCTHRVVLKALYCAMAGATAPRAFYTYNVDPASIGLLRYADGLPVMITFNDTRHLRGDHPLDGPKDF